MKKRSMNKLQKHKWKSSLKFHFIEWRTRRSNKKLTLFMFFSISLEFFRLNWNFNEEQREILSYWFYDIDFLKVNIYFDVVNLISKNLLKPLLDKIYSCFLQGCFFFAISSQASSIFLLKYLIAIQKHIIIEIYQQDFERIFFSFNLIYCKNICIFFLSDDKN